MCCIGVDYYKVSSDHSKVVVVYREDEACSDGTIDEAQKRSLIRGDLYLGQIGVLAEAGIMALPADDDGIGGGKASHYFLILVSFKRRFRLDPVCYEKRLLRDVPIMAGWSINHQRPSQSVGILHPVMAVVPGMAMLQGGHG